MCTYMPITSQSAAHGLLQNWLAVGYPLITYTIPVIYHGTAMCIWITMIVTQMDLTPNGISGYDHTYKVIFLITVVYSLETH